MDDLQRLSEALLFERLIAVARNDRTIYYSDLADLLSYKVVPGHVADQQIGPLVGSLMNRIWEKFPDAPPINMLVVSKARGVASEGADYYLKTHLNLKRLPRSASRKLELVVQSVSDVWNYDQWDTVYRALFGRDPRPTTSGGSSNSTTMGKGTIHATVAGLRAQSTSDSRSMFA